MTDCTCENFEWLECYLCGTDFVLPRELYDAAQHSEQIHFWCPYGHVQHFRYKNKKDDPPPPPKKEGTLLRLFKNEEK